MHFDRYGQRVKSPSAGRPDRLLFSRRFEPDPPPFIGERHDLCSQTRKTDTEGEELERCSGSGVLRLEPLGSVHSAPRQVARGGRQKGHCIRPNLKFAWLNAITPRYPLWRQHRALSWQQHDFANSRKLRSGCPRDRYGPLPSNVCRVSALEHVCAKSLGVHREAKMLSNKTRTHLVDQSIVR